jgi:predicted AAA+ superfamily ATPase
MGTIIRRLLDLDLRRGGSAFLWGPRRVGKTYWLRERYGATDARFIDLLRTDLFAEYAARPALLRERFDGRLTIIDEIQKLPALLDEVHWLIENRRASFILTGSSARKLRRGHANLLAGRARRHELGPLCLPEIRGFGLEAALAGGLLPPHFLSADPAADLRGYVADYLKEEIAAEAAVRNLPAFAGFLRAAAVTNAELINYANLARDCGVSAKVVQGYVEILEDTLLGARLPPWRRARKRRLIRTEKFYFFDVGVANHLAQRRPAVGTPEFGKAFEHWIHMELTGYRRYRAPDLDLAYWRASTGQEVDFILGELDAAVECKGAARVHGPDLAGLRALAEDQRVKRRIIVCLEREPRTVEGIEILPWRVFLDRLWAGEVV